MKNDTFIKDALNGLELSQEKKERIWDGIETQISAESRNKKKTGKTLGRFAGTAAAVFAVFFMLGVCSYAATGGKIADVFLKRTSKEAEEDIIKNTLNVSQRMEVYAPELYVCNKDYFVFAHLRGMVIYDRKKDCVASLVDLQEIDCNNFDTESRFTRIVEEKDRTLVIFNEQNGRVDKVYYECDLTDLENPLLIKRKIGETIEALGAKKLCNMWKKYKKAHYIDTFNSVPQSLTKFLNNNMYSENSFIWKAKDNSRKQSALIVRHVKENPEDVYYSLFTLDKNTKKHTIVKLNIEVTVDNTEGIINKDKLPKFVYTGNNAKVEAICKYMCSNLNYEHERTNTVYVPAPLIYKTIEKKNKLVIIAELAYAVLTRNGNVLQDIGGGFRAARLYLKKTNSGYRVVKVELAGDGSKLLGDIERFTKECPNVKKKFFSDKKNVKYRIMLRKMLKMYLKENSLDIVYYKNYGGDKEKIANWK